MMTKRISGRLCEKKKAEEGLGKRDSVQYVGVVLPACVCTYGARPIHVAIVALLELCSARACLCHWSFPDCCL